jgi:hypothetical protein
MAFNIRIRGLAKLISTLLLVCKVIDTFAPSIREFVPAGNLAAYDSALAAIKSGCDVLRAIDYMDATGSTNAPWGI